MFRVVIFINDIIIEVLCDIIELVLIFNDFILKLVIIIILLFHVSRVRLFLCWCAIWIISSDFNMLSLFYWRLLLSFEGVNNWF
jgi:hypothetical protein